MWPFRRKRQPEEIREVAEVLNGLLGREFDPSLNEHERRVCLLNLFWAECVNGGWTQYLWNTSGDSIEELVPVLKEFRYSGIVEALDQLSDDVEGSISRDREKRWAALEKVSEELDNKISELISEDVGRIWDDVERYIRENAEHFGRG